MVVVTRVEHYGFVSAHISGLPRSESSILTFSVRCAATLGNDAVNGGDESKAFLHTDAHQIRSTLSIQESGDQAECCTLLYTLSAS